MKHRVTIIRIICALLFVYFLILISNTKLLISGIKIEPGEKYYVHDYGDLGSSKQASLYCRYFNGRQVLTRVFWFSPNNILGKDSCPVILRD
jgi:hypothetical protein